MDTKKEKEMTPKEWLSRAYKINEQILSKEENIRFWRELAEKTTSNPSETLITNSTKTIKFNDNGNAESINVTGRMEQYSMLIADGLRENEKKLCELIQTKRDIEIVVSYVKDTTSRLLLEERYINWKSWGEIANLLRYGETYAKKELHGKALKDIEIIIKIHLDKPLTA